jgi:hypothetical protein
MGRSLHLHPGSDSAALHTQYPSSTEDEPRNSNFARVKNRPRGNEQRCCWLRAHTRIFQ